MHAFRIALTDFWRYEVSVWFNTLAHSLVSIFIPVHMLASGYGIGDVVLYYFLYNLLDVPLNFVARGFIRRFGARHSILVATLMIVAFFVLFDGLTSADWPTLILMAVCAAIYDSFYWVAHIYLFVNSSRAGEEGKDTGTFYAVKQVALACGPLIGAGTLLLFGQQALFVLTIALFLLSTVPLLEPYTFEDKPRAPGLTMREFFARPKGRRAFVCEALYAVHDTIESHLFPVFVFLLFGSLASVAIIPVMVAIVSIATVLFLGHLAPGKRWRVVAAGTAVIAVVWVLRLIVADPVFYYASVLAMSVVSYPVLLPIDSAVFENGKESGDALSASMYRNISYMGTNVLLFGVLALVLNVFEVGFMAAAASMAVLFALTTVALAAHKHEAGAERVLLRYRDHQVL